MMQDAKQLNNLGIHGIHGILYTQFMWHSYIYMLALLSTENCSICNNCIIGTSDLSDAYAQEP